MGAEMCIRDRNWVRADRLGGFLLISRRSIFSNSSGSVKRSDNISFQSSDLTEGIILRALWVIEKIVTRFCHLIVARFRFPDRI